jgi:hypothetical protein
MTAGDAMTVGDELDVVGLPSPQDARVLLWGPDTLYFSCDFGISDAMRARLEEEKRLAQELAKAGAVHCPEWLGARVRPTGAKGGYAYLVETDDFTIKILGDGIPNRPGLYFELRSLFLHMHPQGAPGACEEALAWACRQLLADQDEAQVRERVSFAAAKLSRADLHCDWQGGYAPSLANVTEDLRCFIRPGKTKWGFYGQGHAPTGYTFGKGLIQARLYNKTREASEKENDTYFALLHARHGAAFNLEQDVWRLEFELKREGAKGFRLYTPPDVEDDEAEIEAELSAEDLQHVGTLPRFFARLDELFQHLTQHWLRLVVDNGSANRSRWPLHPTWAALRTQVAAAFQREQPGGQPPLDEDQRALVRGVRYAGRSRVLRRLTLGVVKSLEVEDASPVSAALQALDAWSARLLAREAERAEVRRRQAQLTEGRVPRWVAHGMGAARLERAEQVRHRVQMLLGIAAAQGVLPLELKPAHTVTELLDQQLEQLEWEATSKGGIQTVLEQHFAKLYHVRLPSVA